MSWRTLRRGLYGPATVEHTVPPPDVVPPAPVLDDTAEAAEVEQRARIRAVTRLVHRTLLTESLKAPGMRNAELVNMCLEVRSALEPSELEPGSQVLREAPPVGVGYAQGGPVVPGYRWYAR